MGDEITIWKVISTVGKGIGKTIEMIGQGANATVNAANVGASSVRDSMPVTEITTVFNTTDKVVEFTNRETARDHRSILAQTAVSLKTDQTAGAWIPWFDPPLYDGFDRRRIEVVIDGVPVMYIWQRGDFVYWSNRLDSEGKPAKAYKMAGVNHTGGARVLVIRNDPETGYSAFLSHNVPTGG